MNCDEAFDALTDADSRESDDLQQHMNMCPRCRQMREVLAPALSLFDPHVDDSPAGPPRRKRDDAAESIRKPFLSVEAVQMARETAQKLTTVGSKTKPAGLRRHALWLTLQVAAAAAAVAIVFSLFAPVASGPERRQSNTGVVAPVSQSQCLWTERSLGDRFKQRSNEVVASCVRCHFQPSIE